MGASISIYLESRSEERRNVITAYIQTTMQSIQSLSAKDGIGREDTSITIIVGKEVTPENIVDITLHNSKMWDTVANYVTDIIIIKEEDKRKMESEARIA